MFTRQNVLRFTFLLGIILLAEFCITGCWGTTQQKQIKKQCYSACLTAALPTCIARCAGSQKVNEPKAAFDKRKALCYTSCAAIEGLSCVARCSVEAPAKIE